jgi:hypothetical protein
MELIQAQTIMVERHTKKARLRELQEAAESEDGLAPHRHDGKKKETIPRPKTDLAVIKANQHALSVIDASVIEDNTSDNRAMVLYNTSSWVDLLFDRWTTLSDDPSPSQHQNPYDDTAKLKSGSKENHPIQGKKSRSMESSSRFKRSSVEDYNDGDAVRSLGTTARGMARERARDSVLRPQLSKPHKSDAQNRASNHSTSDGDVLVKTADARATADSSPNDYAYVSQDTRKERSKEKGERREEGERKSLDSLSYVDLHAHAVPRRERGRERERERERERARPQSPPSAKSRSTHMKSYATNEVNSSRGFKPPRPGEWPPSEAPKSVSFARFDTRVGQSRETPGRDQRDVTNYPATLAGILGFAAAVAGMRTRAADRRQKPISNHRDGHGSDSDSERSSDW